MSQSKQTTEKNKENELQINYCMNCNKDFLGEEPKMCCSGRECGCMGMPTEPVVCSKKCYDVITNRYK